MGWGGGGGGGVGGGGGGGGEGGSTVNRPIASLHLSISPQLLSPSPSCVLIKFSIQKGWQTQLRVNESQSPWLEQFNWQTAGGEGTILTNLMQTNKTHVHVCAERTY